jgi:hypothetical protein
MCQIFNVQFNDCAHREQRLRRCQASFDNAQKEAERKKKKKGWFWNISSVFSCKKDICGCASIDMYLEGACASCAAKADEEAREVHENRQAAQNAKYVDQDKRFNSMCSMCTNDGRLALSEERNLEINSGLCCARALDEYTEQEQTEARYGRSLTSRHGRPPATDASAAPPHLSLSERRPTPWHNPPPQTIVKSNERPPESRNSTPYESMEISPTLVKEYLTLPGTRLSTLNSPGKFPSPMHKEPDIDWNQWAKSVQTHHGRYPPPSSPPQKSLPNPPSKRPSKCRAGPSRQDSSSKGATRTEPERSVCLSPPILTLSPIRVSPLRISELSTCSVQSRDIAGPGPNSPPRPDSSVLIPQFPYRAFTAERVSKPDQQLRSMASTLENAIDETMEFWNRQDVMEEK